MQGIEILNKEPIMVQNDKLLIAGFICLGLTLILSAILCKVESEKLKGIGFYGIILSLITALTLAIAYKVEKIPSDSYTYEAIIDESVPIQEVYKHYKVIEQKGKIWILEDKEK